MLIGASSAINVVDLPGWLSYLKLNVCENIKVIISENAKEIVSEKAILYISGNNSYSEQTNKIEFVAPHISLTRWADIFLVLPVSANIIGKTASGIADDLISTAILSSSAPVVFYPCMNKEMWDKKVVQRNVDIIKKDGHYVIAKEQNMLEVSSGSNENALGIDIFKIKFDIAEILKI